MYKCRLEPCREVFSSKKGRSIHEKLMHGLNIHGDTVDQVETQNRLNIYNRLSLQIDQKLEIIPYKGILGMILFFGFMVIIINVLKGSKNEQ